MNISKLALRNTGRNLQRTIVTISAMAFACAIMIFFSSMMAGMMLASERQVVEMNMGDIQIHQHGYLDDPDLYTLINDDKLILTQLHQMGLKAAPRLFAYGLLATHGTSSGVKIRGIDIPHERQVTKLDQHLSQGDWLDDKYPNQVVLGKKLAATLGVSLGDELIFIGQSADGFMANDIFYVRGVLQSVSDGIDRSAMYIPEQTFRNLMAIPKGAHEIVVRRSDEHVDLEQLTQHIQAVIPQYEVKNWKSLMPIIAQMLNTADQQSFIMLIITYIAVATIILNAMLMSVFERMHEFGIMKAIGVSPWQIVRLIYAEAMIQVGIASTLALATGWWVSDYFATHGMDMSHLMDGSISFGGLAFDPIWYTYVSPESLWAPIIFLIIMTMLAVIYPALKAAWIKPLDAIYYR